MNKKYLGYLISVRRSMLGLVDEEIAECTGVSKEDVRKARQGEEIKESDLKKIIDYLGIIL